MKLTQNIPEPEDQLSNIKHGNIHEQKEKTVPEEKPAADFRLKIAVIVLFLLTVIVAVRGKISNSGAAQELASLTQELTDVRAEALTYDITEDEDGRIQTPEHTQETGAAGNESVSSKERNEEILDDFATCLLTWDGVEAYMQNRQELIDTWGLSDTDSLLTNFMPALENEDALSGSMRFVGSTVFTLENNGTDTSYFLIYTVRYSAEGTSADGTVGIRLTVHEDGTVSDVTAQTLTQKTPVG